MRHHGTECLSNFSIRCAVGMKGEQDGRGKKALINIRTSRQRMSQKKGREG